MRTLLVAVVLAGPAAWAADETNDDRVRKLDLKDLNLDAVKADKGEPVKVADAKELAKVVPDKAAAEKIASQVDFAKEYLVVFAWKGSGKDQMDAKVVAGETGPVAVFTLVPGRTEDLRQHRLVYAVRKGVEIRPKPGM